MKNQCFTNQTKSKACWLVTLWDHIKSNCSTISHTKDTGALKNREADLPSNS